MPLTAAWPLSDDDEGEEVVGYVGMKGTARVDCAVCPFSKSLATSSKEGKGYAKSEKLRQSPRDCRTSRSSSLLRSFSSELNQVDLFDSFHVLVNVEMHPSLPILQGASLSLT